MNKSDFDIDKFLSDLETGPTIEEYNALQKALQEKAQILKGQENIENMLDESTGVFLNIQKDAAKYIKQFPPVSKYLIEHLPAADEILKIHLQVNASKALAYVYLTNLKNNNKKNRIFRVVFIDEPLEMNLYLFSFMDGNYLLEY